MQNSMKRNYFAVLFLALLSIRNAHTAPFFVKDDSSDVISQVLTMQDVDLAGIKVFCELDFKTKQKTEASISERYTKRKRHYSVQSSEVLDNIFDTCVRKTVEYWSYEVCFGNKIRQFHGAHSINLGQYSKTTVDYNQVYLKGDPCEALPHESFPPRTAALSFFCSEEDRIDIVSVEEVSVCNYEIKIAAQLFCDSSFPLLEQRSDANEVDPRESWVMSLVELDFPRKQVLCSAKKLLGSEAGKAPPIAFDRFKLNLRTTRLNDVTLLPVRHGVRNDLYHLELDRGMYQLDVVDDQKQLSLSSGQGFEGEISFVSVQAYVGVED